MPVTCPGTLSGSALDWAVAKCEGLPLRLAPIPTVSGWWVWREGRACVHVGLGGYSPSTNWAQGGPILEREGVGTYWYTKRPALWLASMTTSSRQYSGPTLLVAAMRCYVSHKVGDEVLIPEEFLNDCS